MKLADLMMKEIVPVSFIDTWPPLSLAIQFATKQFIYWKPDVDFKSLSDSDVTDTSQWSESDVDAVADLIIERYI